MSRGNKETNRWQMIASTVDKRQGGVEEKRIDIPTVDNGELRMDLIARIEAVTSKIIKQISTGRSPCISYSSGRNAAAEIHVYDERYARPGCSVDTMYRGDFAIDSDDEQNTARERCACSADSERTVDFAIKRSRDKFVLMTIIMAEVHRLLLTNTTKTRRSFYYDLKNDTTRYLVPHQRYVDRALNHVADLLKCAPWDLRLLATAKGLVAGNMTITLIDDHVVDCTMPGGALIPQIASNVTSIRTTARFVLVVEKDAAFQKLLEENCPRALNCVLVTGKGYPDVATRMLVRLLSEEMGLPVYVIVDADPFGVDIMLIYRYGSTVASTGNDSLICPNTRWLGILPSELIALGAKTIPLTDADLAKLRSIETRAYVNGAMSKQLGILRNGKAEIEAVSSFSKNFLTATYLPYKIDGQDYI